MIRTHDRRLFLPLSSGPYEWFASGRKNWELRRYGRQYTKTHIVPGRIVELRHGYGKSRDSLWGTIAGVQEAFGLDEFFSKVPFHDVIPVAADRAEAIRIADEILNLREDSHVHLIGFRIELER